MRRLLLSRAYFWEIFLHLVVVLGGVTVLVALGAAVRASATSQGAPVWIPLLLIPLMVGNALPYLIPAALLTAVVLTYGRMAADGEAIALRAAGVHPLRALAPALAAGMAAAALSYPLSAVVLPELYTRMRELSYRLRFAALENTNPGASELHYRGLHMSWRGRDRDGVFRDVVLSFRERGAAGAYAFDPGVAEEPAAAGAVAGGGADAAAPDEGSGVRVRLRARRAAMTLRDRVLEFVLEGGRQFVDTTAGEVWKALADVSFVRIDLDSLGERPEAARKPDDFRSSELRALLGAGEPRRKLAERYRYTLWKRGCVALAAVPLALAGGVLGWRLRRGGFLSAFAAAMAVLLLIYYPLYYLGDSLQQSGALPALPAAALPVAGLSALLLLLAVWPWLRVRRR